MGVSFRRLSVYWFVCLFGAVHDCFVQSMLMLMFDHDWCGVVCGFVVLDVT